MEIQITVQGATTVNLDELNQLHHFKRLTDKDYAKCRNSITDPDIGFGQPLSIWIDEAGTKWMVDGHQRYRTLTRMREEGYTIPPLPANIIIAPNKRTAAKRITAFDSKYGEPVETDFTDFLTEYGISYEEVEPYLDIQGIDEETWSGSENEEETPPNSAKKEIQCPSCSFKFEI